ncbi:hypothetical protein HPB48_001465 [Haemaphysalis longicornis]|uniref:Uncharacterized protein n=1 Tax=Haemaphysalis longicornis TaxID=44386 RepID=A0A9J6FI65_HAELO|nr:hypothetical protein HPB48_001465 [Haemaphysalis longicornis]
METAMTKQRCYQRLADAIVAGAVQALGRHGVPQQAKADGTLEVAQHAARRYGDHCFVVCDDLLRRPLRLGEAQLPASLWRRQRKRLKRQSYSAAA